MDLIYALKFLFLACFLSLTVAGTLAAANFTQGLQPILSADAQIYLPGSDGYNNATTRWASAVKPGIDVVVKVASEVDVQQTASSPFSSP